MKKLFFLMFVSSVIFSQEIKNESLYEYRYGLSKYLNTTTYEDNKLDNYSKKFYQQSAEPILNKFTKNKKNPALAILYSMLIPGMGELYAGNYESGKYFTITDGILWGIFAGFNIYGHWKENDYKSFAQSKGGVNLEGKDSDYFATIGIYISIDEYNRKKELNREFYSVYDPQKDLWKWGSEDQRKEYRQLWLSSEQAYNNVRFAVGALILNRLISAVNAVRLVSAYNKNISTEMGWNLNFGVINNPGLPALLTLNFYRSF